MRDDLFRALKCLACGQGLVRKDGSAACAGCGKEYPLRGEAVFFRDVRHELEGKGQSDSIILSLKNFLKRSPALFALLYRFMTPVFGHGPKTLLRMLPQDALIVNVGSGILPISPRVADLDYMPYPNVSVVADASRLPFKDNSLDGIISESLLEHLPHPEATLKEMHRILKPGGLIYTATPFMLGYHSSPNDFYRWTTSGHIELHRGFSPVHVGANVGPTSALTFFLAEWLALALSFGSKTIHQLVHSFFMLVFAPFNWLDVVLIRHPLAFQISRVVYFIGKKQ